MTTNEHDRFGPIHIQPPDAAGHPENAPRLRSFMRGARATTQWGVVAVVLSIPSWGFMDFDPTKSVPAWASVLFALGVIAFMTVVVLIPLRIIGRIILLIVGDGSKPFGRRVPHGNRRSSRRRRNGGHHMVPPRRP